MTAEYATAQQAYGMEPDAVALLGDEQYEVGKLSDFEPSFEQAWGGLRLLERPAPGNHEYYAYKKHGDNEAAQNGTGYFGYFNGHAHDGTPNAQGQAGTDSASRQGWYSYNLGHWHVISLNVECNSAPFSNDCSTTDNGLLAQETRWLSADLQFTIGTGGEDLDTLATTATGYSNPNCGDRPGSGLRCHESAARAERVPLQLRTDLGRPGSRPVGAGLPRLRLGWLPRLRPPSAAHSSSSSC